MRGLTILTSSWKCGERSFYAHFVLKIPNFFVVERIMEAAKVLKHYMYNIITTTTGYAAKGYGGDTFLNVVDTFFGTYWKNGLLRERRKIDEWSVLFFVQEYCSVTRRFLHINTHLPIKLLNVCWLCVLLCLLRWLWLLLVLLLPLSRFVSPFSTRQISNFTHDVLWWRSDLQRS